MKQLLHTIGKLLTLGYKKAKIWDEFKGFIEGENHSNYAMSTVHTKTDAEYFYYSPFNNKVYLSKDYAPMGKFANKVYYEYMGEL